MEIIENAVQYNYWSKINNIHFYLNLSSLNDKKCKCLKFFLQQIHNINQKQLLCKAPIIWFIFKISIVLFSSDWHLSDDFYLRWKEFLNVYSSNYFTPYEYALKLTKLVHFFKIRFHCCRNDMNIVCKLLFRWKIDKSWRQIYP